MSMKASRRRGRLISDPRRLSESKATIDQSGRRSASDVHRFAPTNPAPPVTSTRLVLFCFISPGSMDASLRPLPVPPAMNPLHGWRADPTLLAGSRIGHSRSSLRRVSRCRAGMTDRVANLWA